MFGYIIAFRDELSEEEKKRYDTLYCSVCHALRTRYGQLERWTLNYDMTFLALYLSALYEPAEEEFSYRCSAHPFHQRTLIRQKYIDYAADMTIALAYYKCLDDWKDESKLSARLIAGYLKGAYQKVEEEYPRQCRAIASSIEDISALEAKADASIDDVMDAAGRILQEVFVYREDFWAEDLRRFGYAMGRFIYLMDAVMDYEQDEKKGQFNPLRLIDRKPTDMESILMMEMGEATAIHDGLPILQDEHLIRNILYGGVWLKYKARYQNRKDDKS